MLAHVGGTLARAVLSAIGIAAWPDHGQPALSAGSALASFGRGLWNRVKGLLWRDGATYGRRSRHTAGGTRV